MIFKINALTNQKLNLNKSNSQIHQTTNSKIFKILSPREKPNSSKLANAEGLLPFVGISS